MNNYSKLSNGIDWVKSCNYSNLISYSNQIANNIDGFFKKYNNLNEINVINKIQDKNHLIKFILKCSNLYHLNLKNSQLTQDFFNELPAISSLLQLSINEDEKIELNFDFLRRMMNLEYFNCNQEIKLSNRELDLDELVYPRVIHFRINKQTIIANKLNMYGFSNVKGFKPSMGLSRKVLTSSQVIDWCTFLNKNEKDTTRATRSKFKKMKK